MLLIQQKKTIDAMLKIQPLFVQVSDIQAKYNAQRNLQGRSHYATDETLRFHHSRILNSNAILDGLFFKIVESVALDMHNTKRGFRVVVFDLFGNTVERKDLDQSFKTKKAAEKDYSINFQVSPVSYYYKVLIEKAKAQNIASIRMSKAAKSIRPMAIKAMAEECVPMYQSQYG
tara:strand:+ start:365 stop:886 length:522 start_codon:yes stop_codon:yes gene_type:complete